MKTLVKRNFLHFGDTTWINKNSVYINLYPVLLLWLITGMYLGILVNLLVLATLVVWSYQRRFSDILIGFIFILLLSDSRHLALSFAGTTKTIYILAVTIILLAELPSFNPLNKIILLFLPFFFFAFVALLYSDNVLPALMRTVSYLLLILIIPNFVSTILRAKKREFLHELNTFFLIFLIGGLIFRLIFPSVVIFVEGRYSGLLGNPNGLGIFLLLYFIFFSLVKYFYQEIFSKRYEITVYLAIGFSLILSGSRTAIFTILLFLVFNQTFKISKKFGFLLFLFIMISSQLIISNIESIIISLNLQDYFRLETLSTGSGRIFAFDVAWKAIQDNFFIGKGFGYTTDLFIKFEEELSLLNHQGNVHNSYLTIWLDTGFWGLITFIIGWFGYLIKWSKSESIAMPILYSVFFSSFFESWLSASLNPFTIQLLIIISIIYYKNVANLEAPGNMPIFNYRRIKFRA